MLTEFVLLVLAVAVLVVLVFALVVIGIQSEPRTELSSRAPGSIAAISRRILGVYVGRPGDAR